MTKNDCLELCDRLINDYGDQLTEKEKKVARRLVKNKRAATANELRIISLAWNFLEGVTS